MKRFQDIINIILLGIIVGFTAFVLIQEPGSSTDMQNQIIVDGGLTEMPELPICFYNDCDLIWEE